MGSQTAQKIRDVADVIRERGLQKNYFVGPEGQVCLSEAVHLAAGGDGHGYMDGSVYLELLTETQIRLPQAKLRWLSSYNDRDETTVDDVLSLCEDAAVRVEAA